MSNAALDVPIGGLRTERREGGIYYELGAARKSNRAILLCHRAVPATVTCRFRPLGDGLADLRVGVDLPGARAGSCDSAEPAG